jgi:hypothetical protein
MPHDLLVDVRRLIGEGESFARRSVRNPEMFRQTVNIVVGDRDARVTAAVAGTFIAIKTHDAIMRRKRFENHSYDKTIAGANIVKATRRIPGIPRAIPGAATQPRSAAVVVAFTAFMPRVFVIVPVMIMIVIIVSWLNDASRRKHQ